MKKIGLVFWMWVLAVPALAQVPEITYQAVIMDSQLLPGEDNRAAPMGDKDLCLKFVFKNASGISEYEEVITTRTDAYGMVNVIIGTGRRTGGTATSFPQIVWNAQAKFLEVSFDKSGSCSTFVLLSSQQFTAVPFALYAATSGNLGPAGPAGPAGPQGSQGPAGLNGANGTNGSNGVSAYQQWLNLGNTGNEADFIAALRGAAGAAGATGPQGVRGTDGAPGPQGTTGIAGATGPQGAQGTSGANGQNGQNGPSAYQVAVSTGFVGTESQWLSSLTGTSGPVGPTGPTGIQGAAGPIGPAGLTWKGAWSATGTYVKDDVVGFNGASWFCFSPVSNSSSTPNNDPTKWALLASQGANGPQGPTGSAGTAGATGPIGLTGPTGPAQLHQSRQRGALRN